MAYSSERQADLAAYLPTFMAEYEEINKALTAENPEFTLLWEEKEKVLKNQFILTADSMGLSRFEKMLGITPSRLDTLESRRKRVLSKWFVQLPYTERMLVNKLTELCGEGSFTFIKDYDGYLLDIRTDLRLYGQIEELEELLNRMVPCNIRVSCNNRVKCNIKSEVDVYSGIRVHSLFRVTNDFRETVSVTGFAGAAGAVTQVARIII